MYLRRRQICAAMLFYIAIMLFTCGMVTYILYEITNFKDIIDDRVKNRNLEKWVAEKLLDKFNKEMLVAQSSRKYKRTTFNEIEYLT